MQQVRNGQVNIKFVDETVRYLLRTKFSLGLFESMSEAALVSVSHSSSADPYPYSDYLSTLRTPASQVVLQRADRETTVLLENKNNALPLSKGIGSIALIGPQVNRVSVRTQFQATNDLGLTHAVR